MCDAWAAMRADRAHRAALPVEAAREQPREGLGTQSDPAVVAALLALEADGPVGDLAAAPATA